MNLAHGVFREPFWQRRRLKVRGADFTCTRFLGLFGYLCVVIA